MRNNYDNNNRERLSIRGGGGCLMLFGTPFFLAGLAVIAATLGFFGDKSSNPPPLFVGIPFGLIFVSVGALLMFGRSGFTIDKSSRKACKWSGLLFPMFRKEFSLDDFNLIKLTSEIRHNKNSTYTVYPVCLVHNDGENIEVEQTQDYLKSRKRAEQVAKICQLNLQDSGRKVTVEREWKLLDECLLKRFQRSGDTITIPAKPATMQSALLTSGREVQIEFPPVGVLGKLKSIMPLVFLMIFGSLFFSQFLLVFINMVDVENGKLIVTGVIGSAIAFCILRIICLVLEGKKCRSRVTVSAREGIKLQYDKLLGSKIEVITAENLEEFYCYSAMKDWQDNGEIPEFLKKMGSTVAKKRDPITALSDDKVIEFATHLPPEEKLFIFSLLFHTLVTQ